VSASAVCSMLYADDRILSDISSTNLQKRFGEWPEALESKCGQNRDYGMCKDSRDSADQG